MEKFWKFQAMMLKLHFQPKQNILAPNYRENKRKKLIIYPSFNLRYINVLIN